MCGRFSLMASNAAFRQMFEVDYGIKPWVNIAPTHTIVIVRNLHGPDHSDAPNGLLEAVASTWGFVPSWKSDESLPMFNAKCETVATLPTFQDAFKSRRCLVPVSWFYEWETLGKIQLPWSFTLKKQPLFALAGLWEGNDDPNEPKPTSTILTTAANSLISRINDRMPVIIRPEDYETWLAAGELTARDSARMFEPFPAREMGEQLWNRYFNYTSNEGPVRLEIPPMNSE